MSGRPSIFSQAVQRRMDALRLLQADMGPILGRQTRVSKLLTGALQPNLQDLCRLHYSLSLDYSQMIPLPSKTWRREVIKHLKKRHAWP